MIQDHSDHGRSNEPMNPLSRVDSSVHLIYHDPSDPDHLKGTHPKSWPGSKFTGNFALELFI